MNACRFRGGRPRPRRRRRGYTLIEMLIAMTLLILLGSGLVAILRQTVSIWSTAESRGRVYERARVLLDLIDADLRSTAVRYHGAEGEAWIRFIADRFVHPGEQQGVQRVRFVRTISGEIADPVLRDGGSRVGTKSPMYFDGTRLARAAQEGLLRAPAGLMEIFYIHHPRSGARQVWRGVRTPVGGPDSLFVDANVEPPGAAGAAGATVRRRGPGSSSEAESTSHLERFARPVARGVLFLGFRFWTPTTDSWRGGSARRRGAAAGSGGPSDLWDSTRALISADGARSGAFSWKRRAGSLDEPGDDVFPEFVEVTVVMEAEERRLGPRLAEKLTPGGSELKLSTELRFPDAASEGMVFVDGEWIAIESSSGRTLVVAEGGRGRRGTAPEAHSPGARVSTGTTFRRVVALPSFRTALEAPWTAGAALRRTR